MSGRKCVWCGAQANSKEHVFPQWLRRMKGPAAFIAENGGFQEPVPRIIARTDPDGRLIEYEATRGGEREPNLHEVVVKQVCIDCNTKWMSQLESGPNGMEPLLRRMALGIETGLSTEEGRKLATWAHKNFLMYDLYAEKPDRRYRSEDYREFFSNREPFGDVRLYLAASDRLVAPYGMYSDSNIVFPNGVDNDSYAAANGKNCGAAFFAVDDVIIIEHWFAPEYPSTEPTGNYVKQTSHRNMLKLKTQQIWPPQDASLAWPPRRKLSPRQTESALLSLFNVLGRLPVQATRTPPPQRG